MAGKPTRPASAMYHEGANLWINQHYRSKRHNLTILRLIVF